MYWELLTILIIILTVILIFHIIVFIISENDRINLNRNRSIHSFKLISCSPEVVIKKVELIGTSVKFSRNYISEFLSHYDFLFTDENKNKYIGYIKNLKNTRAFIIEPIILANNWTKFKLNGYKYKKLNYSEYDIDSTIGEIVDTFKKLNRGYHIFYHNCHHKTKQLVNILVGKNVYTLKKYTIKYCVLNFFNDVIKAFF